MARKSSRCKVSLNWLNVVSSYDFRSKNHNFADIKNKRFGSIQWAQSAEQRSKSNHCSPQIPKFQTMKSILKICLFSGLILSMGSCRFASRLGSKAVSKAAAAATSDENAQKLTDAEYLQKAEDALRELPKFKGKSIMIFQEATFYKDGRISICLQDPSSPNNVDQYQYANGSWEDPQPVQLSGDGEMKDNLIPLDTFKFATVAKIANTWMEKAKSLPDFDEEKNPLTMVGLKLGIVSGEPSIIVSDVETTRAKYDIDFNLDGTLKSFKKE